MMDHPIPENDARTYAPGLHDDGELEGREDIDGKLSEAAYDRPTRDKPVATLIFNQTVPPERKWERIKKNVRLKLHRWKLHLLAFGQTGGIQFMDLGPRLWFMQHVWRKRRNKHETLTLEKLPGARKLKDFERFDQAEEAKHIVPAKVRFPFKPRQMRFGEWPTTHNVLKYRDPPASGKTLAGVGDPRKRRVHKFFHTGHGHIHGAIEFGFHLVVEKFVMAMVMKAQRENRKSVGPVALQQQPVHDTAAMARHLKEKAKEFGAGIVGCTEVVEEAVYAKVSEIAPHAIVLAVPMHREKVLHVPSAEGDSGTIQCYLDVGRVAIKLADYIRSLGWEAEADTNLGIAPSKVIHVPLAVNAGLGQLGRHTSVISPEFGSNMRLAVVLTDIPMAFDEPIDIGLEEMCANCTVCMASCPVEAIYDKKVIVRGVEKWHIDYDRCMPYFAENEGCGVCQTVCPWSEPGKAPLISMLQKQRKEVAKAWPDRLPEDKWQLALSQEVKLAEAIHNDPADDYWHKLQIQSVEEHAGPIHVLKIGRGDEGQLPEWAPGAHVELRLPSGKVRAYSLSNSNEDRTFYRLGIKIEENGNGGSREVASLKAGDSLLVSRPGNNYPLQESHSKYYLCAGGIGITPMLPIAKRLHERGLPFELHYSVKDEAQALFLDEFRQLSGVIHVHGNRDWLETVFEDIENNAAVCTCGPGPYMDAVRERATENGLPGAHVYSEDFNSDEPDEPFDVVFASSGERLTIEPGETIARELSKRGVYVPVSCGYGICGTCTLGILDGEQIARDNIFNEEERRSRLTACCSRGKGSEIVLDI